MLTRVFSVPGPGCRRRPDTLPSRFVTPLIAQCRSPPCILGARRVRARIADMPFCSSCGADTSGVQFCSKCGQPVEGAAAGASGAPGAAVPPPPASAPAAPVANDNVLGAVAYITVIPAIIFLLLEPYNKNRFVRFHSLQCLMLAAASFIIYMVELILAIPLAFLPVIGTILSVVMGFAIFFGLVIAWIIAVIKAYGGEEYRLPIIGDYAAKYV